MAAPDPAPAAAEPGIAASRDAGAASGGFVPPTPAALPHLPRGVRVVRDAAGGGLLLLAPERVFTLDGPAAAVLAEVDGRSSIAGVAARLAARFHAPRARIEADICAMLAELALKGVVAFRAGRPEAGEP